jgi:hypothetical protein
VRSHWFAESLKYLDSLASMADSLFIHGQLHAPYFIFLRCAGRYSDMALLRQFGLSTYLPTKTTHRVDRYAILADDGQWILIADDWYYTLWHMPSTHSTLGMLAKTCDVFACCVADCDRSFDFVYYQDSRLVRRYVIDDTGFQGGRVVENVGSPLPDESTSFKQTDEVKIVLGIANSLDIKTDYTDRDIRIYRSASIERSATRAKSSATSMPRSLKSSATLMP